MEKEKTELEKIAEIDNLGRKFIRLEIKVLNQTNKNIFNNGMHNTDYLGIPEWKEGIDTFLLTEIYPKTTSKVGKRILYYRQLIALINGLYIEYGDNIKSADLLNLKLNLQFTEILQKEDKIKDLEEKASRLELINEQEKLTNQLINDNNEKLNLIRKSTNSKDIKKILEIVLNDESLKSADDKYTREMMETFKYLHRLLNNKEEREWEIHSLQEQIRLGEIRKLLIEKTQNEVKELAELKKQKTTAQNYFYNEYAVKSTMSILDQCCDYYYDMMFIKEFMSSLKLLLIEEEAKLINPLTLLSYERLQTSLRQIQRVLKRQKIKNKEFSDLANRYIYMNLYEREVAECRDKLFKSLSEIYKTKNPKNVISKIFAIKRDFTESLRGLGVDM